MLGKLLANIFFNINGNKLQPYIEQIRITMYYNALVSIFSSARYIERTTRYIVRNVDEMNALLREDLNEDFMINDNLAKESYKDIEFWIYVLYKSNKFEWIVPKISEEKYEKYLSGNKFSYLIGPTIDYMFKENVFFNGWPTNTQLSFAVQKIELKWSLDVLRTEDKKFSDKLKSEILNQ